ncbi:hypothetical protein HPB50_023240 [Hyalomma asiaticum]|uniref:Uncharacterized protein n=1 Tax=Hyalomma asiaticum TaxID=266040 RepID=A0ACB7TMU0_HYAAI|nr:hypothetical protein HPB50_023240 [Hyalomma asiaticum]
MPAESCNGSDMPSGGAEPGQKRLNIDGTSASPESKRQQTEVWDDESTVTGDYNAADMEDVDEDGFKVVRHRKGRTVGVPVLVTATEQGRDLRQASSAAPGRTSSDPPIPFLAVLQMDVVSAPSFTDLYAVKSETAAYSAYAIPAGSSGISSDCIAELMRAISYFSN